MQIMLFYKKKGKNYRLNLHCHESTVPNIATKSYLFDNAYLIYISQFIKNFKKSHIISSIFTAFLQFWNVLWNFESYSMYAYVECSYFGCWKFVSKLSSLFCLLWKAKIPFHVNENTRIWSRNHYTCFSPIQ